MYPPNKYSGEYEPFGRTIHNETPNMWEVCNTPRATAEGAVAGIALASVLITLAVLLLRLVWYLIMGLALLVRFCYTSIRRRTVGSAPLPVREGSIS